MSYPFAVPVQRTFQDEAAFATFAAAFASALCPGDAVALSGGLGAGKTSFVRAAVRALHGADQASSPTFPFRHRYEGSPPIEHLDLYRIEDPREIRELGVDDAFDGTAIVFVEWWERSPELLPSRAYEVRIEGSGEGPRRVSVERRP